MFYMSVPPRSHFLYFLGKTHGWQAVGLFMQQKTAGDIGGLSRKNYEIYFVRYYYFVLFSVFRQQGSERLPGVFSILHWASVSCIPPLVSSETRQCITDT